MTARKDGNKMTSKEKILDISMLLGTAIAIIAALFANFAKQCDELYESTFRLHILANSDSIEDQRIKYALRDYILSDLGTIFEACETSEETKALAERNLPYIEECANEYLHSIGCSYKARCTVGKTHFPTRVYKDVTLPAGDYNALRIVLGSGSGKNWWCVLYPSVCLEAAAVPDPTLPRRGHYERFEASNRATAESLSSKIEFRFALYDFIKQLFPPRSS